VGGFFLNPFVCMWWWGGDLVVRLHIIVLLGYLVESFKTAFNEDQVNQLLQLCLNTLEA
jgi:hypothetical protein